MLKYIVAPTPQSEVYKMKDFKEEYTHIRGDVYKENRYATELLPHPFDGFLKVTNLYGREIQLNKRNIHSIESGYHKVIIVFKTNNHNFAPYVREVYFVHKDDDIKIIQDRRKDIHSTEYLNSFNYESNTNPMKPNSFTLNNI